VCNVVSSAPKDHRFLLSDYPWSLGIESVLTAVLLSDDKLFARTFFQVLFVV